MRSMKYIYGIDIGGTFVKLGRFDETGTLLEKWQLPVDASKYAERMAPYVAGAVLVDMERMGISAGEVAGIGIGCPGTIDEKGVIHGAENLQLDQISVTGSMRRFLPMEIRMENDANCAALGEYIFGEGKAYDSMAFLTLGTGVGGGIIAGGSLLTGAHRCAAEFGHMQVDEAESTPCSCGRYGCLEQYCSARGITRMSGGYSPVEIFTAMQYLDQTTESLRSAALRTYERFSEKLAKGCALIADVADPAVFVIGGGVSNAGDVVVKRARELYRTFVYPGAKDTEIRISKLKNDAGIYGAAALIGHFSEKNRKV